MANGGVIENGVKMVGEIVLPGASLLMDGDMKAGTGHAIVGLVAWAFLGPARLLVSANSFSKSVSDQHLHTHLLSLGSSVKDTVNEGVTMVKNVASKATSSAEASADASADASDAAAAPA